MTIDAGWSAPQPPTPHPSGDRPWPLRAPGSSFCGKPFPRWNPLPAARLDVPARSNPHVGCRRRVGGPVLKGDTWRPFFSERPHRVGGEPETPVRRGKRDKRQYATNALQVGFSGDFAVSTPPWDQNGSPYCGDGRFFEFTINSNGLVPASGAVARCSERVVVAAKVPTVTMARVATIAKDMSIIGRILWLHLVDVAARVSPTRRGAMALGRAERHSRSAADTVWSAITST